MRIVVRSVVDDQLVFGLVGVFGAQGGGVLLGAPPGLSLQNSSRGSESFFLSLAWLAAALSSSTSSQAATHSPLVGSPAQASSAFFTLSATFSDKLSGAAPTGLTTLILPDLN
nr:hypothetical protein Saspl_012377 [Ipomoea batatas]